MHPLIPFVRWYNRTCPWTKFKHELTRCADRRLPRMGGVQCYGGVGGTFKFELDLGIQYHRMVYMNLYELLTLRLQQRILRAGDRYIDVGANFGLLAVAAAERVGAQGHVYAFEPHPTVCRRLQRHVAMNGLSNVSVFNQGCWDTPGQFQLREFDSDAYPSSSMEAWRHDVDVSRTFDIETVRIDDTVSSEVPIRLIKIDTDGAEWPVLRGAAKTLERHQPHVIVELLGTTTDAFGYRLMDMVDWILQRYEGSRLHLIRTRRIGRITREELAATVEKHPHRGRNLWIEPG